MPGPWSEVTVPAGSSQARDGAELSGRELVDGIAELERLAADDGEVLSLHMLHLSLLVTLRCSTPSDDLARVPNRADGMIYKLLMGLNVLENRLQ